MNRQSRYISVVLICILLSCKTVISIEGVVQNLPGDKIYLQKKGDNISMLDSAIVQNGVFKFKINKKRYYLEELVRLKVSDTNCFNCLHPLFLFTDRTSDSSQHWSRNNFFLERGKTLIKGDFKKNYLLFESGNENKLYFLYDMLSEFWDLNENDTNVNKFKINKIKNLISENSNSYFLLTKVHQTRGNYSEKDLKDLMSLFDKRIMDSPIGKKLKDFSSQQTLDITNNVPVDNFKLHDNSGNLDWVFKDTSKITILNFWASWCVPCKAETPILMNIYNKYKNSGLDLISISFDQRTEDWINDLNNMHLSWRQFIMPITGNEKLIRLFNAYSIPMTIVLSRDRKIISSYKYDNNLEQKLESILDKKLKDSSIIHSRN